ncbi:RDD family protein [Streptomyces lichenis]|uniref:RDD family protein n=1 Tax=Streptomyces lichenis TaxID=2306967 RepID=A0ABT0I5P9_9ACTN|nr:RDD family protein [Streptomyces lichenis]MCK8676658.1 RDD family protein [Streptomyces lichenis]
MSAPTPATGDGSPTPGYYPDPSIPGYIRFWNGAAWVPGTSRPAPKEGEASPVAPAPAAAAPAAPAPAPAPAAVEETGPVFFDEMGEDGPRAEAPQPAAVWQADASHQSGFGGDRDRRVSWGAEPGQDPRTASAAPADPAGSSAASGDAAGGDPTGGALPGVRSVGQEGAVAREGTVTLRAVPPRQGERPVAGPAVPPRAEGAAAVRPAAHPAPAAPAGTAPPAPAPAHPGPAAPARTAPAAPARTAPPAPVPDPAPAAPGAPAAAAASPMSAGDGGGSASWAQQVHRLAQPPAAEAAAAVPAQPRAPQVQEPVIPWKPPVADPFLQAAQAQAAARPAGLGRRLAARLVDTLVLGALAGAAAVPLVTRALDHIDAKIEQAKQSGETVTVWLLDGTTGGCLGGALAVLLVLGVLYEALPTARWGRTLGKRLCGIEVRDIESHQPPSFGAALRRWLVYGVLGLLVVGVGNVLWCLFDRPWRQCWHDKAAHTFVAGRTR